jgi:drug/metabolite transporter (DMT)-like permease
MSNKSPAYLALTGAAICWGLAPVTTRQLVAHLDPLHLLLIRFSIASLIFLPFALSFRSWQPRDRLKMFACGLLAVLGYYLPVTIGGRYIPSSITGLLVTTQTLWMAGLAVIFTRERLTPMVLGGIFVSTLGIALLFAGTSLQPAAGSPVPGNLLLGGALTLLAAIMWSTYSLALRPLVIRYGARSCTALTILFGLLPLLFSINPALGQELTTMTLETTAALLVLTLFSTVIGNFLWSFGLARLSGVQSSLFLYLIPVVSLLGGMLWLHETLSLRTFFSGALIVGGVAIAQFVKPLSSEK